MAQRLGNAWAILVGIFFILVYKISLSFQYTEGDDAMNVVYHALGRRPSSQPPYSPYHGMMDVLLGVLPADEPVLRVATIVLTASAAPAMVLLMLELAFRVLGVSSPRVK